MEQYLLFDETKKKNSRSRQRRTEPLSEDAKHADHDPPNVQFQLFFVFISKKMGFIVSKVDSMSFGVYPMVWYGANLPPWIATNSPNMTRRVPVFGTKHIEDRKDCMKMT